MNIVQCIHQSWYQLLITDLICWIWYLIPWIMIQLWKGGIICLDKHQLFNLVVAQSISQLWMNEAKSWEGLFWCCTWCSHAKHPKSQLLQSRPLSSINQPILMNCLGSTLKDLIANIVWRFHLSCFCYKIGMLQCHFVVQFIHCICWIISIPREDYILQLVFEISVFHVFSKIYRIKQI